MENTSDKIKKGLESVIVSKNLEQVETLDDSTYEPPKISQKLYEVDDNAARAYSKKLGVNLEEAKERLALNYIEEVEKVDAKEISLKNAKALRMIGPKVSGLEMREQEIHRKVDFLQSKVNFLSKLEDEVNKMTEEFKYIKEKMAKSLQSMIDYHQEFMNLDSDLKMRMLKLEEKTTFLGRIKKGFNKLLCLLNLK
jgi:hypothetical protein